MNKLDSERIEYYLGKDKHKNLFFTGNIPTAWEFPSYHIDLKSSVHKTINPVKPDVSYTINNLGYHSHFDYDESLLQSKNIVCLGDSNTFGLLLSRERTWVAKLQEEFPQCCVLNFGLPGAAPDTAARIGANVVEALGDSIVAVLVVWPSYSRREFASNQFKSMVYRTPNNDQIIPFDDYWDFIDWQANSYNFYKNRVLLEAVCRAKQIEFFDLEINDNNKYLKEDVLASYGKPEVNSYGFATHSAIACYFAKKINHEPSKFELAQL